MKLVLDSSVGIKTVLPEAGSNKAIQLWDDYRQGTYSLLAPDVYPVEVGHALTRAERAGRIVPPAGWALGQSAMADAPLLFDSYALMPRAYAISSQARIGIMTVCMSRLPRR